jgi:predicted nucleic acid-binding protein
MEAMTELRRAPVTAVPVRPYVLGGFRIAHEIGETVYDALYLAVAEAHECRVVTADHELLDAVAGTPWEGRVVALGDLPAG